MAQKDFEHIAQMSEDFREWITGVGMHDSYEGSPVMGTAGFEDEVRAGLAVWNLRINLAIAQQLSVIAAVLKRQEEREVEPVTR